MRCDQRPQLRHGDAEPQLRSRGARGLGRASGRLGVRRLGAAGSAAARVGRVGYFRRWLDNFFVDDNLATVPADFTPFSITAPVRQRLPGGGGYTIDGLYDVVPAKFGQVNDYFTKAENFGEWYQHYNGILLNVTARPGTSMQGGLLTGQTVRDLCGIRNVNPELNYVTPANASGPGNVYASPVFPYCRTSTGFTTRVTGLATYRCRRSTCW